MSLWRWLTNQSAKHSREALRKADRDAREIDRITDETSAGAQKIRIALTKLGEALQGRARA